MKTAHTINDYTADYSSARWPRPKVSIGDTYRLPEDPHGYGATVDWREWSDFSGLMSRSGLTGEFSHTEDGWDYYHVIESEDEGNEDGE